MVERLRIFSQHIGFLFFMYGGRLGIDLGNSLPCFSCPFVSGCAGHCYLMALQRSHVGFQTGFDLIFSGAFIHILWPFVLFLLFFIPLSKLWCSWLCPFCLFQDWISWIRKKLKIREMIMTQKIRQNLKPVKYVLLALLILIPMAIANFKLHPDWGLPFCRICPAKPILPLFAGNPDHFHIDFTNTVTLSFTLVSMLLTAGFLVGIFFKERFFCLFCPMLALMHLLKKISPVRFEKKIEACSGCGNCQRMCPMDIEDVFFEKNKKDVLTQDCLGCMACVESCPGNGVLTYKWLGFKLFSSSKHYLAGKWSLK
ncbi:4Fe-4S binding protein [Desulfospira joergensenii]|uniref:4Fe-4S binding protein n=1 Tax=Desulfospira joergensenii TaxID=53329 RepID=UPI0003B575BF|nr:4Fe-4S binding protein [Desulfospira joergensenii]